MHRVGVKEFRENLAHWLDVAASGEDVVVTERGRAKVRVTEESGGAVLERMAREGRIRLPTKPWRPVQARIVVEGEPVSEEIFRGHGH